MTAASSACNRRARGAPPALHSCGAHRCCDSSPGKHATAHFHRVGHPLIQSFEPDEDWYYCYIDDLAFEIRTSRPGPSHT